MCPGKHTNHSYKVAFIIFIFLLQQFFKLGTVNYAVSITEEEKNAISLKSAQEDVDIVVEPDIEIQTLSDEFQMDCNDPEPWYIKSFIPFLTAVDDVLIFSSTAVDADLQAAAKESLCCWSCKTCLFDRRDTLAWESMEFCSDKCLSKNLQFL